MNHFLETVSVTDFFLRQKKDLSSDGMMILEVEHTRQLNRKLPSDIISEVGSISSIGQSNLSSFTGNDVISSSSRAGASGISYILRVRLRNQSKTSEESFKTISSPKSKLYSMVNDSDSDE
jgi:hypothetical protein